MTISGYPFTMLRVHCTTIITSNLKLINVTVVTINIYVGTRSNFDLVHYYNTVPVIRTSQKR